MKELELWKVLDLMLKNFNRVGFICNCLWVINNNSHLFLGDHVIPLYIPQCGDCKFCLSPKTNVCSKIRVTQGQGKMPNGTSRFTCKGQSLYHFMGCSTFSEYTVVADISLCKVG